MKLTTLLTTLLLTPHPTTAATPTQWRPRSIYQLLTDRFALANGSTTLPCDTAARRHCGGSWRGVARQLDYIQGMGFSAVWISPVTRNVEGVTPYGEAYHGYWQRDLGALNEAFGGWGELRELVAAVRGRGMYLMVDVVANHNGWNGNASSVDYSQFHPFNDRKYYHDFCTIQDWGNQTQVEECWLGDSKVELVDLRTADQDVVDGYGSWIKQLITNYSIDGLRIDTVKNVDKPFWTAFNASANIFSIGEVVSSNVSYTCAYQSHLPSVLNYPAYYAFTPFLNSTSSTTASLLSLIPQLRQSCRDTSVLGTFTENHDVPRLASQTQDLSLAQNALVLTLLWDGIPIVYAGQEQHYSGAADPANREATWLSEYSRSSPLYKLIALLNKLRSHAITLDEGYLTYNIKPIYNDTHTVALRKGFDGRQVISIVTNNGENSSVWTLGLQGTGWSAGTPVLEVLTCGKGVVGLGGKLDVEMERGLPRVYMAAAAARGSGICEGGGDHGGKKSDAVKKGVATVVGAVAGMAVTLVM